MAINKVIYGDKTLIDLTSDTVSPDKVIKGITAHDKSGEVITGTCDYDSNTQDATAAVAEILEGKTAYVRGQKLTGTMPNRASAGGTISAVDEEYTIQNGFHDGSGKVGINATEKAKIIAGNIKQGISILGVEGTYTGEAAMAQSKTVTPTTSEQTVLPDEGYDFLSSVKVLAIPYEESENPAGGTTVTIAGA
ncbi:MAG: hypothetical protein ACLU8W_09795 [Clostridia bacterium]